MRRRLAAVLGAVFFAGLALVLQPSAGANSIGAVAVSERVTLLARPTVLAASQATTLFGSVDNGRAGEIVTIQAKDCGQRFFTGISSATTRDGGAWTEEYFPAITTTFRAVWKGAASAQVTVRLHPRVSLFQRSPRRFEIFVGGAFWRKSVLIQRRQQGSWKTVRSVLLTDTYSQPGSRFATTGATFGASYSKGTQIRAVLPLSQARPCYLAGVSNTVRT